MDWWPMCPQLAIQMVKPLTDELPITGFLIANFFCRNVLLVHGPDQRAARAGRADLEGRPARARFSRASSSCWFRSSWFFPA